MTTLQLGQTDLTVSRLSYGCMRIVGTWNPGEITSARAESAREALIAAYEAGYTLFDHADIYCSGACEEHHGRLLKDSPELRRQTIIATKCGIRFGNTPNPGDPGRYDFSKDWILKSCEGSLKRLGVETIDLYQLHRPDVLMNPEEVAEAFTALHRSGKVRWFGVSNFLPTHVSLLQKSLPFPIVSNQVEVSLKRLDCFVDGTLDQCLADGIVPLSWSPLGGGSLGEGQAAPADDAKRLALLEAMDKVAIAHAVSRTVIALAWLMKHPSGIIPIVGSANPANIADSAKADGLELSREEWYTLYVAARGERMP
ncbi:MAG: aldo/keto reductase [Armatimonadetes bacterium]|nr:aldo/keto reductase [Armatimonadota bacterium]